MKFVLGPRKRNDRKIWNCEQRWFIELLFIFLWKETIELVSIAAIYCHPILLDRYFSEAQNRFNVQINASSIERFVG